jgi:hypothetical protein
MLANTQIEAVAGVAGAGVFWPGANVWFEDPDAAIALPSGGGPPGGFPAMPGSSMPEDGLWPWRGHQGGREEVHVPAGQGVLWSVGPDKVDDRACLATSPFDGEGVPTRRTPIVENGVLKAFLYDAFTARKAKTKTTGNASRGYQSLPHIGFNNLLMEPGTKTPEEIIKEIPNGLYVTAMLGRGANMVTGEYSRGAAGFWVEDGAIAYPVEEITIAGNLKDIFRDIVAIGRDVDRRGARHIGSLLVARMTVAGQ